MKSTKYFFTSVFFMFFAVMSHFIRYYQVLMCAIYRNNIEVISLSEALAAQYAYYITLGLGIAFSSPHGSFGSFQIENSAKKLGIHEIEPKHKRKEII